jgi:hypothetical protein
MANLVAAGSTSGGFIAGLLIGVALGFLVRPAVRSWVASREWAEASRRARLTDEVLAHMDDSNPTEEDVGPGPHPPAPSASPERGNGPIASNSWQPRP